MANCKTDNIPENTKKKMFKDAGMILREETNIVPVPGTNKSQYFVLDISASKERKVKINTKTCKATCDAKYCHNWNSFKMCSHIVALAEKLHILESVMEKYSKSPLAVNATNLVNTNMSASRGKKGTKSTQIRKGQSNKKATVITDYSTIQKKDCGCLSLKQASANETSLEPFELTFIHGLIKKCYGCGGIFSETERENPFDIIIKHLEIRPRFNKDNREWYIPSSKEKSNAYYHLKADCIKTVHKKFSMNQVTVPLTTQIGLSDNHKRVMQLAGLSFDT